MEDGSDLYNLHTKVVIGEDGVQAVQSALEIGEKQYEDFVKKLNGTDEIYETLKKNNLKFFKAGSKSASKTKRKNSDNKQDLELFSQLYVSCQTADLTNFF